MWVAACRQQTVKHGPLSRSPYGPSRQPGKWRRPWRQVPQAATPMRANMFSPITLAMSASGKPSSSRT